MFVWATVLFFELYEPPADAFEVSVVGKQWMWYLQHPEGRAEINELHVPLGQAVKLTMTSQDVIHSFFVPAFRIKQDVLPGRYTTLWFRPTKVGRYHLFCAEYCGTNHSRDDRLGRRHGARRLPAMAVGGGSGPSMAEEGERLFVQSPLRGLPPGQPDRPRARGWKASTGGRSRSSGATTSAS